MEITWNSRKSNLENGRQEQRAGPSARALRHTRRPRHGLGTPDLGCDNLMTKLYYRKVSNKFCSFSAKEYSNKPCIIYLVCCLVGSALHINDN